MGEAKLIRLVSKKIYSHLKNIFDVRIISEENHGNLPEPVLVAKTIKNISQKWS